MSRNKFLSLLVTSLLSLVAILPGCIPHSTILKAAWISAIAVPAFDISESQFETKSGALPFHMWFVCEPYDFATDEWDETDIPEALIAEFKMLSNGTGYSDEEFGEEIGIDLGQYGMWFDSLPCLTAIEADKEAPGSGEDVGYGYAVWTQTESEAGTRVWYKNFTLDRATSEAILDTFGSGTDVPGTRPEINLVSNRSLLVWEFDPNNLPEQVYVPVMPAVTISRVEPESTLPPSESPQEPINFWELQDIPFIASLDVTPPDNVMAFGDWYRLQNFKSDFDHLIASSLNRSILTEESYREANYESSIGQYYGFEALAGSVNESPEEAGEEPELGTFGFVSDGLAFCSVYNIPVDTESLLNPFNPNESYIIELPHTFWLNFSPETGLPGEPSPEEPGESIPQHDLEVIVSPPGGGSVTLDIDGGVIPADGEPELEEGDPSGWEVRQVYQWTLSDRTSPQEPLILARLTAVPAEGYRFVGWYWEDAEGTHPYPDSDSDVIIQPIYGDFAAPEYYGHKIKTIQRIHAYFAPIIEEPEDLDVDDDTTESEPMSVPLSINIKPRSETTEDESGCRTVVNIDYEVTDVTGGSRPISDVSLRVDGKELYPWSGVPTSHYQNSNAMESACSEVHVIEVVAGNNEGQTLTATKDARIPPLVTHFTYAFIDVPGGEECQVQLFINYQAVDLTTPDNPIINVVVKGNGATWDNSGNISTDDYEGSFSRVVSCGHTYTVEVIGTDADGNKYTYSERIEIPTGTPPEEPQDEPPPVQTTLYAAFAASASCTASDEECSCNLSISFDGKDLTGGDYPVTKVVLKVNGGLWHDSGDISPWTPDSVIYHRTVQQTVGCGATFNIQVTVTNSIGQTVTSTGSITTPVP